MPSQRRNRQWTMVINNLADSNDDDEVKPVNFRPRPSLTATGSSVAQIKDQPVAVAPPRGGGLDDTDWITAPGRRLLISTDDTAPSVSYT